MQEIVTENGEIQIEEVPQYTTGKKQWDSDKNMVYEVKFSQLADRLKTNSLLAA